MRRVSWREFDYLLLGTALALMLLGVAMIYSSTHSLEGGLPLLERFFIRQSIYAVVGLGLMGLGAALDYRLLANFQRPVYAVALGLLFIVFMAGKGLHGVQRWLDLQFFHFQPSELAKVLLILVLARHLSANNRSDGFRILSSVALMIPPMALVYLQPDLGTALLLGAIWLGMLLLAGVRPLYMALLGLGGMPVLPLAWRFLLKDYMRKRLVIFMDPNLDPLGAGYNVLQARISIGAGGIWGQGFGSGTQSQLHFLQVRHTDFIFPVIAEELGFVGAILLLVVLAIMLWRVIRVAGRAQDEFGQLIACGVAVIILAQSFVNIGMNMGILPTTGLPLPFVSYGGSSLVTFLLALGLVESVALHSRRIGFQP